MYGDRISPLGGCVCCHGVNGQFVIMSTYLLISFVTVPQPAVILGWLERKNFHNTEYPCVAKCDANGNLTKLQFVTSWESE